MTFHAKNVTLAGAAIAILQDEQPCTLRQLFYRLVSQGSLPSTAKEHYTRLGRIVKHLRESDAIPMNWIVDHTRRTHKSSSWLDLADFGETVRAAYRKDLWAGQQSHVEILIEKDALAATLETVTSEYGIALRVIRGYSSLSYENEIGKEWACIEKPIHAYYIGDHDPSGYDLERDARGKLESYSGRDFEWTRLGVLGSDFDDFGLLPLAVKDGDKRAEAFMRNYGTACAEVDALPPTELRRRVEVAIRGHIDQEAWKRLQKVENGEKETLAAVVGRLGVGKFT